MMKITVVPCEMIEVMSVSELKAVAVTAPVSTGSLPENTVGSDACDILTKDKRKMGFGGKRGKAIKRSMRKEMGLRYQKTKEKTENATSRQFSAVALASEETNLVRCTCMIVSI